MGSDGHKNDAVTDGSSIEIPVACREGWAEVNLGKRKGILAVRPRDELADRSIVRVSA